ncbi:MAG: hypothetical protein WC676_04275 [Candidatus Omnitrophota bacterium]
MNFSPFTQTGLMDGRNPCALTLLFFWVSLLLLLGYKQKQITLAGILLLASLWAGCFASGLGALKELYSSAVLYALSKTLYLLMGFLALIFGAINAHDWIKAKKKTPEAMIIKSLVLGEGQKLFSKKILPAVIASGFFVSFLGTVAVGHFYFPVIFYVLNAQNQMDSAFVYLLVYSLAYLVPITVISALIFIILKLERMMAVVMAQALIIRSIFAALFLALGLGLVVIFNFV